MKSSLIAVALLFTGLCRGEATFEGDWSKWHANGAGPWSVLHTVSPDRFRVDHVAGTPKGAAAVRVEVRRGDKVNSWSGERSEVTGMRNTKGQDFPVNTTSGHEFYGLSIKLDAKWQAPDAGPGGYVWGTFFQLHGQDSLHASPSIALMAESDFHLDVCAGDLLDGGKRTKVRPPEHLPFTDGALNPGRWTEFLLDVVWAVDTTGSVTVYRREHGKVEWTKVLEKLATPTLQYAFGTPPADHYWKTGYYRSEGTHTSVLWLGPMVRGTDREKVAKAAFGKP